MLHFVRKCYILSNSKIIIVSENRRRYSPFFAVFRGVKAGVVVFTDGH